MEQLGSEELDFGTTSHVAVEIDPEIAAAGVTDIEALPIENGAMFTLKKGEEVVATMRAERAEERVEGDTTSLSLAMLVEHNGKQLEIHYVSNEDNTILYEGELVTTTTYPNTDEAVFMAQVVSSIAGQVDAQNFIDGNSEVGSFKLSQGAGSNKYCQMRYTSSNPMQCVNYYNASDSWTLFHCYWACVPNFACYCRDGYVYNGAINSFQCSGAPYGGPPGGICWF